MEEKENRSSLSREKRRWLEGNRKREEPHREVGEGHLIKKAEEREGRSQIHRLGAFKKRSQLIQLKNSGKVPKTWEKSLARGENSKPRGTTSSTLGKGKGWRGYHLSIG